MVVLAPPRVRMGALPRASDRHAELSRDRRRGRCTPTRGRVDRIAPWAVGRTDGVRPTAVGTPPRPPLRPSPARLVARPCRTPGTRFDPPRLTAAPGQDPVRRRPSGPPAARHPRGALMKAIWNGTVIAESDDTVVVEGNHYFPAERSTRACCGPRTPTRSARGRAPRRTGPSRSTAPRTPTPRGTTRSPRMPPRRSATGSPSGRASPSSREALAAPRAGDAQIASRAKSSAKTSATPNTTSSTLNGTQHRWVTFQP